MVYQSFLYTLYYNLCHYWKTRVCPEVVLFSIKTKEKNQKKQGNLGHHWGKNSSNSESEWV